MSKTEITRCVSVTHVHLLAALRAELRRMQPKATVRILDAGCGAGGLLAYLHCALRVLDPQLQVELYGFDVSEPGVQKPSFLLGAIRGLTEADRTVPWEQRVLMVSAREPWPFDAASFDIVVSNQVLEHVADHGKFFHELGRVLRPGGVSLHCFPVRECVWEAHLHMPWVHRLAGHAERVAWIRLLTRLGLGKFQEHRRQSGISLERFVSRHADFINFYTNYLGARELLRILKSCHLRGSYTYSAGLYLQKLYALFGRAYRLEYRAQHAGLFRSIAFWCLKHLSSVTLRIEKADEYRTIDS